MYTYIHIYIYIYIYIYFFILNFQNEYFSSHSFSGIFQDRPGFIEGHFNKHFVYNTPKKRPRRKKFISNETCNP